MISKEELEKLLLDIENSRVERTISTTNTDKFGEAICAFCNDYPDSQQAGYLIVGAKDNGSRRGLNVTDQIQINIAAIRSDGNIQPQPAMAIEKFTFADGDLLIAEVSHPIFHQFGIKEKSGFVWVHVKLLPTKLKKKYFTKNGQPTSKLSMPCPALALLLTI